MMDSDITRAQPTIRLDEMTEESPVLLPLLTELATTKKLILGCTLLGMVLGLGLSYVLPSRYSATVKLMPPRQVPSTATLLNQLSAADGASSLAAVAGAGLGLKNPNDLYIAILQSRPIADAVIQKFNLMAEYHSKDMTAARQELAKNTTAVAEKEGMISVSVVDTDRQRSAQLANAYTEELIRLTQSLSFSEASQRASFYEAQLRAASDKLAEAEVSFQEIQQSKGLVQLDAQARAMIEGAAALRAQVAMKQVQVDAIRSYASEGNPNLSILERELAAERAELGRFQKGNASDFGAIGLKSIPAAGLDYLRSQRELQFRQSLYSVLLKQFEAAKLDEAKNALVIQVIAPAIAPDRRSSPKRLSLLLISGLGGFVAACSWVLLRNRLQGDSRFLQDLRLLVQALSTWG